MSYPVSVKKNDYFNNRKNSSIYTPSPLANWVASLVQYKIKDGVVLDPACGNGSLLKPFVFEYNKKVVGIDKSLSQIIFSNMTIPTFAGFFTEQDFLDPLLNLQSVEKEMQNSWGKSTVDVVVCNPPFNYSKGGTGRKLLPELFLEQIVKKFGPVPTVLFTPMGFVLNQRKHSKRWKWLRDECSLQITGRIALPLDIFPGTQFHQEVLLFNFPELKPHYWVPQWVIDEINKTV